MSNNIHHSQKRNRNSFQQAVEATPDVRYCYHGGKQAVKNEDRDKVELNDPRKCRGSLFIDKCLYDQNKYLQDHRWDYAIDYNGEVFFFEVHPAKTNEVENVLNKLEWLKRWLSRNAPEIYALKSKSPYFWVQTNGYYILPGSFQERRVVQKGLKPIPKLLLK